MGVLVALPVLFAAAQLAAKQVEYGLHAHQFDVTNACGFDQRLEKNLTRPLAFHCFDAGHAPDADGVARFVFFLAYEPTLDDRFGHSWVAFGRLLPDTESVKFSEFASWGFWGAGHTAQTCPWMQLVFAAVTPGASLLGFSRADVDQICQKGRSDKESRIAIADPAGVTIRPAGTREQMQFLYGGTVETIVAVRVDEAQYEAAQQAIIDSGKRDYLAFFNDCTTLSEDVARRIGLYVPSRLIYPMPATFVARLAQDNMVRPLPVPFLQVAF